MKKINVYLEVGKKKTFAGAVDWPGWCRSGRDAESALQALFEYGPRYGRVIRSAQLGFEPPTDIAAFVVVEKLKGNATTEFGAPAIAPSGDDEAVKPKELERLVKIMKAALRAFGTSVKKAGRKSLSTGPRGGGRQIEGMVEHVLGSNEGYLNQVGWKLQRDTTASIEAQLKETRQAILKALEASAGGEIPAKGPRGGVRWKARYFARRTAWHILDHAWEIEDRLSKKGDTSP